MIVVMMMKGLFPVNHASHIPKLLHMAGDCDWTLLIKAVLLLSAFQKVHEQRVIEIYHRHHESLLLLSLTYLYGQAPFRHIYPLLTALPLMVMVMIQMPVKAFTQAASVVLGIYLLSTTTLDQMFQFSTPVSYTLLVIMVILLMAPLAIPVKMTFYRMRLNNTAMAHQPVVSSESLAQGEGVADKTQPLLNPSSSSSYLGSFRESDEDSMVAMLLAEGEGAVKKKRRPKRGEDFKFSEAVVKADFWLLFFVYFVGVGSGVTVLNNLAQIGIAQGARDTTILLSIFSFCNFVGRLGGGAVSEHFVRSQTIPRTIWMTCTQLIMAVTYLLFASAISGTLYAATALLGICYGVQFSIMIPTVSELFGLKHFGLFYNFMSLGNPLGAFLFSGLLAGYIYDSEVEKQQHYLPTPSNTCFGPNCFRITFLVLAGLCGLGSIVSIILSKRIRPVYQMLYASGSFRLPQSGNH